MAEAYLHEVLLKLVIVLVEEASAATLRIAHNREARARATAKLIRQQRLAPAALARLEELGPERNLDLGVVDCLLYTSPSPRDS